MDPWEGDNASIETSLSLMFSLLAGLYDYFFSKEEIRILIVGLDGSGKTTLLERLKTLYTAHDGLESEKIRPTVGLNVARFEAHGAKLIFWDLGGASNLRSLWDKYYVETHGILFVLDASDARRLDEAKGAIDRLLGSNDLTSCPLLVWCNKCDKKETKTPEEVMLELGVDKMSHHRSCRAMSGSAIQGDGIKTSIEWLVQTIKSSDRPTLLRTRTV